MEIDPRIAARANFTALSQNPYPGRGIIAGLDTTSQFLVQVYFIMGRSDNSRNRILVKTPRGRLYTEPANSAKMHDRSLLIYDAMKERKPHYIVGNGDQTETVATELAHSPLLLQKILVSRTYEPDKPNFTQRITAVSSVGAGERVFLQMSILRKSQLGNGCDRLVYDYETLRPGFGYYISTYSGDGDPLPPFRGDPLLMPLGDIEQIADIYWSALNEENRVALAVKFIERESGHSEIHVINKYE